MLDNFDNKVFPHESRVNTQTVFCTDGRVNISPCSFEDAEVHYEDNPVAQRGSMRVKADGTSEFRPYRRCMAPRFLRLYASPMCEVRMYRKVGQLVVRFPCNVPTKLAARMIIEATRDALNYLKKTYPRTMNNE